MKSRFILPVTLVLTLCGCSLQQRIDKAMSKIEEEYAASRTWEELPLRTLSWQQALQMVETQNLEIRQQQALVDESERNELSVYTQMIPGVTYYSYFTSSLRDLTSQVNSDRLSSTININFYIPTLTQVPYRVYSSKAATYAQMKTLEGKKRELTAALYKLVRNKELTDARQALEAGNASDMEPDRAKDKALSAPNENKWGEIAKILGNAEARWVILPESMPRVTWEKYAKRLDKLDPLIVCQFALRLEQARLAQYSIALRYLPTIDTSIYSPSLFSSSGGTYSGTFLDSKDTKLNLNINYSLDTKMDTWNHYMRSKERYEQTKQEISAQMRDYRNKLKTMRKSYEEYALWRSVMQKRLSFLRSGVPSSAEEYLNRRKDIYSLKKELLSQENQAVETEAALILQYGLLEK